MKRFDLYCQDGHLFDAWFHNDLSYQNQLEAGLVECPHCGSHELVRVAVIEKEIAVPDTVVTLTPEVTTQQRTLVRRAIQQLIAAHTDDVGAGFVEEARKIHYGETNARNIRGRATVKQIKQLLEEGIECFVVPARKIDA